MIPDAVAAVIAAVLTRHPAASPAALGHLVVAELRAEGWHIAAPHIVPPVHADAA